VRCTDEAVAAYARSAVDLLDVPGAAVTVDSSVPRHVGLGSGTRLALATLVAVATAHGHDVDVRSHAPALGRGGRSGVGAATFETGGFVADAGHPVERFTTEPPAEGTWTVPPVVARHDLPAEWRFVVVLPDATPGRSGETEDESMRTVVERADPGIADDLAQLLVRRVLPAAAEGDWRGFGAAVAAFGRRNGAWYADAQGGVYRPPAGRIVERLDDCPAVSGAGQSSWGPAVYGVTDAANVDAARDAAADALDVIDADGEVLVTQPRNEGATVEK